MLDDHHEFEDGVKIYDLKSLVDYLTANCDKPFRVVYRSRTIEQDAAAAAEDGSEFNRLCRFLFHIPDFTFFINELSLYTTSSVMPAGLGHIITQGRREFIDLVCTVRRKTETHNLLRSQANMLVSFKQMLSEDVQFMRSFIGQEADAIPELKEHEFVYYTGARAGRDRLDFKDPSKIQFLKTLDLNGGMN